MYQQTPTTAESQQQQQQLNYIILDNSNYRTTTSIAGYIEEVCITININNTISFHNIKFNHSKIPLRDEGSTVITSQQMAVPTINAPISSSLTSQCILCREVCLNKNDLIQHLRNHLADDNKTYVINSTSNVTIAGHENVITVPSSLVDLLKLDSKELCA